MFSNALIQRHATIYVEVGRHLMFNWSKVFVFVCFRCFYPKGIHTYMIYSCMHVHCCTCIKYIIYIHMISSLFTHIMLMTYEFSICFVIFCKKRGTDRTGATASHGEGEVSVDFALIQPSGCIFYVRHAARYIYIYIII